MTTFSPITYSFPQIKRVQFNSFSLYSLRPDVSVSFDGGALCLAGANGIGKSTFLATLSYGLTGAVPTPARRFLSAPDYLNEAYQYAVDYFDGRIAEGDRDAAAISIDFVIRGSTFSITRGLFNSMDVRSFTISGSEFFETSGLTAPQRDAAYKERISSAIGLTSFEQFVFLQHVIFTFDESRHLLFWDQPATSQALFLCFGGDPQHAARADYLFRASEKADSRGRNAKFQANNIRKRIELIEQPLPGSETEIPNIEELEVEYERLEQEREEAVKRIRG